MYNINFANTNSFDNYDNLKPMDFSTNNRMDAKKGNLYLFMRNRKKNS